MTEVSSSNQPIVSSIPSPEIPSAPISLNKILFMDNIQSVMKTYHISIVHVASIMILIFAFLLYFVFEEQIKTFGRKQVRALLYRLQTNQDGTTVSTTSKTSTSKLVQFLTYLEHSWFASSDPNKKTKLPSNVFLDVEYQPEQTEEQDEYDEVSESELFNQVRDV